MEQKKLRRSRKVSHATAVAPTQATPTSHPLQQQHTHRHTVRDTPKDICLRLCTRHRLRCLNRCLDSSRRHRCCSNAIKFKQRLKRSRIYNVPLFSSRKCFAGSLKPPAQSIEIHRGLGGGVGECSARLQLIKQLSQRKQSKVANCGASLIQNVGVNTPSDVF